MTPTSTTAITVAVPGIGAIPITIDQYGDAAGEPILLLHGGGGPQTVTAFAGLLAVESGAHVLVPSHPGFGGTARPDALTTIAGIARAYAALLDDLDLSGVTVIGNSIGGWIASELALTHSPRIARLVLVDAVGIEVPGHPVADFFSLSFPELAQLSYHRPESFTIDPATMRPEQLAVMAGNRESLSVYAGQNAMADATLNTRLHEITNRTLVVWGEADRIADPAYGRAFAAAIPGAEFLLLAETGHLPQLETPDRLLAPVRDFAAAQR